MVFLEDMKIKKTKKIKKRPSKYAEKLKLHASFEQVMSMVVEGNPQSTKA